MAKNENSISQEDQNTEGMMNNNGQENNENKNLEEELKEQIGDSGIEEIMILNQQLAEKDEKILDLMNKVEEYEDLLKRTRAEFENYRKRTNQEKEQLRITATEKVMLDLLGIVDNLEKALEASEGETDSQSLREGIILIDKQFKTLLSKFEVTQIPALGKEFDPNYHEAIQVQQGENNDKDIVIKEWQKGYMIGDKILRTARVVVSKANPNADGMEYYPLEENNQEQEDD